MRIRELEIPLGTLRLAACQWGDDDAPALIALHGWLDNAASFARLAPVLATRYRVIALDLPGHGRSQHLPAGARYHFVDSIEVVSQAADALQLERFDLLGHSLGAGIASLAAAAIPARVRRLALIEGLGPLADDGGHTLERWREAATARSNAPDKRLRVFTDIEQAVAARATASRMPARLARPIVERGLREVNGGWVWSSDPRLTLTTPVRLAESQVRRLLAGITAPALLLLAQPQTPYLPQAMMRERAACVADIRLEHLQGGHHLHLQHPRKVAELILASLSR